MEKYIFTDAHFEQLKAAKAANHRLTIRQFSKGIGRSHQTVSGAIKESRHLDAVHALFPMMKITRTQERVKNKGGVSEIKVSVFNCSVCGGGMRCSNSRPMVALNDSGTVRQYFCRECGEPDTTVSFRVGRGGSIADRVKEKMLGLVPSEDYSDREMSAISEAISLISASFVATEKVTKRKAA